MDTFSRNIILMLLGCAMLMGLGITSLLASRSQPYPGAAWLMEGPAPIWLVIVGLIGVAAAVAMLLRGPSSSGTGGADAVSRPPTGDLDREGDAPISDPTVAFVDIEVILTRAEASPSPAVGADIPPATLCRALLDARPRWVTAAIRHELQREPADCAQLWREAATRITSSVPVRGRRDGDAASYRIAVVAHLPPSAKLGDAATALEIMGQLPGDRFLEVGVARVPEEAGTFAGQLTVAGNLAAESLALEPSKH